MKTLTSIIVIHLLLMLWIQPDMYGQGVWIKQATGPESTDNLFSAGGDDCIGFAKQNTQYIYFFDTNIHKWTKVDLGNPQHMQTMKGRGSVIFAYTDELLIGYSSHSSSYDTIFYVGEPINAGASGMSGGYGCTERAVYFVTDKFFYVFDGVIGDWRRHAYFLPDPFFAYNARFIGGDDYIGVILPEEESYTHYSEIACMAYSLPKHTFAETNFGGFYIGSNESEIMSHGFVTMREPPTVDSTFLTGYCSATNQFSTEIISSETGSFLLSAYAWFSPEDYIKKTVGAIMLQLSNEQDYNEKMYAYSTLIGSWHVSDLLIHDPPVESDYLGIALGGTLAAACKVNFETNEAAYEVYDSETGGFHHISDPVIGNDAHTAEPQCANNVMMAYDSTHVWFFNPALNSSFITEGFADMTTGYIIGNHYVAVNVWDLVQNDPDKLYVYNTLTGSTVEINSGNIHGTIYPINSYDMFVFKAGPLKGSGAYFYSSLTESYAYVSFQDTPVLYFDIKNRVAVATSQDKSQTYLYDANTNGVTSIDFSYHYYELGDNFILFAKDNDSVTSYNFTRQEFSHITLNDLLYLYVADSIGLIWDSYRNHYVAYNALSGNWVHLIPDGDWTYGDEVFSNTAVVIRSNYIYAFDPYLASDIPEPGNAENTDDFLLLQNQPNPFKGDTKISYILKRPGNITLTISDMFGNELARLVDEKRAPGEYSVPFNSGLLSEGIYYYTLKFNNRSKTKKMVIIN